MPKPDPEEFRQDVARNRGPGVTVEQVATNFGVHPMMLWKWMRRADIDDGAKPGVSSQEIAGLREARRRIKLLERENEVLRRAAAYLSQAHLPGNDLPAREGAGHGRDTRLGDVQGAQAHQTAVLPLARQAGGPRRPHPGVSRERALRRREDPDFGYRFLADEARDAGARMTDRTAWRICRDNRWWSVFGKKHGRGKKAALPGHDDLVSRNFTASGPNRLWLADITEHTIYDGKLYLCAIKDAFSNRIVGYFIDARMKSGLAVTALETPWPGTNTSTAASCTPIADRNFDQGS